MYKILKHAKQYQTFLRNLNTCSKNVIMYRRVINIKIKMVVTFGGKVGGGGRVWERCQRVSTLFVMFTFCAQGWVLVTLFSLPTVCLKYFNIFKQYSSPHP